MTRPRPLVPVVLGLLALASSAGGAATPGDEPLVLEVFPLAAVRPVEPLAYGANEGALDACTLRRHGGNRFTAFDWETGHSNAGADWRHQSDTYLVPEESLRGPGALLAARVAHDRERGARSIVTLPLAGFVAADADGPVSVDDTAPSARWKRVSLEPSTRRDGAPDLTDDAVSVDEMVRDLVRRFGRAADGGVLAYALDNEPALWPHTHPRVHPDATRWSEVLEKGVLAARLVTAADPTAQVFGPVLYGWAAFHDLQGAPDALRHRWRYDTFVDWYLAEMADASEDAGRRLLHRLDVHWYPEAVGEERVIGADTSASTCAARVQAPRSLWDPTYEERSWITDVLGEPVALIPRLQESVDEHFPGTGIAITEYNFGAAHHVSGGLAQADALGVFGRLGVAACWWGLGGDSSYVDAAFGLYLGPDGASGDDEDAARFGDLSVHALSRDAAAVSLHAATRSDDEDVLTVVAVHKDFEHAREVDVRLHAGRAVASVTARRFDGSSADVRAVSDPATPAGEGFRATLPPASATLFVVRLETRRPGVDG